MPTIFGRHPSVTRFVSYPVHRMTERQTDKQTASITLLRLGGMIIVSGKARRW